MYTQALQHNTADPHTHKFIYIPIMCVWACVNGGGGGDTSHVSLACAACAARFGAATVPQNSCLHAHIDITYARTR